MVATLLTATPASATPQGDLNSLSAQAQRIENQIQADNQRADVLDEQYLEAQSAVTAAQAQIADGERALSAAEASAAKLQNRLGSRAARLYMGAGNVDLFSSLDTNSAQNLGSRAKYGEAAAATDNRLIDNLTLVEDQLTVQRQALEKQKADAETRQKAAAAARTAIQNITQQQQQLLGSVKGAIRQKVDEIAAARQAAQEAAARAAFARQQAAARAAEAAAAAQAAANAVGSVGSSRSSNVGVDPGNIPAPSGGASAAIAYARAQLGKPYQYAGTGPDSFDCSGLTMMAWAAGGVSMSHNAAAQYSEFPHVPESALQPGDLVFFGNPIHHVGLYVGGGTMIEAPQTGEFVHYSSIGRPDYAGAARP
jgi:cell wall-associated NlpC family hydrolase